MNACRASRRLPLRAERHPYEVFMYSDKHKLRNERIADKKLAIRVCTC